MQILYVHGAGASQQSFQWLQEQLPVESKFFNHDVEDPVAWSIRRLEKRIEKATTPVILLGHSLGGVIATACANLPNVEKLITLNAPFGGIRFALMLSLFSPLSLLRDLNQHSALLTSLRNTNITKPHLALVGTNGMPFFSESNDGVLTVSSQTAIPNIDYKRLPLNHFEMLLSQEVATLIKDFIQI